MFRAAIYVGFLLLRKDEDMGLCMRLKNEQVLPGQARVKILVMWLHLFGT